ncbi:hypothetical protein [Novilysobacter selenitireducens]|uniref:hypothetical protein n=1 Tax=Novilysobacter selenitireducens TaxID=2872639 RepID=UPI001CBCA351|nr:hypothetical protein [Lysobacter selenitireducens]
MPTHSQRVTNRLDTVTNRLEKIERDSGIRERVFLERITAEALEKRRAIAATKLLETRLASLSLGERFDRDIPLPKDFRDVDLGFKVSRVAPAFKGRAQQIEDVPGWVSVNLDSGPFSAITYYRFVDDDPDSFVDQILFHIRDDSASSLAAFRAALTAVYGPPASVKSRSGEIEYRWASVGKWRKDGAYEIELDDSTYLVRLSCPTWAKIFKEVSPEGEYKCEPVEPG